MSYKEALYFIGAILSLSQHPERRKAILSQIESGAIDWDVIVRVSSGHMVLPAFYLNLKRVDLLIHLPQDLVDYCEELTQLNRDRNKAIIKQAINVVSLLSKHNITPIFLKGTAHLLEGLYEDIGERMVGDIDFLVAPDQVEKVAEVLIKSGYKPLAIYNKKEQKLSKHYPRMVHDTFITAVEIHREIIQPPYKNDLGYHTVFKNKMPIADFFVPSYSHQILHNILNVQINDKGLLYGKIMMRQMYDGFLLSFKTDAAVLYQNNNYHFYRKVLYLKLIQRIFKAEYISVPEKKWLNFLMIRYIISIDFPKISRVINRVIYLSMRLFHYPKTIIQAFYKKEIRSSVFRRISDPSWYGRHLRSYKNRT